MERHTSLVGVALLALALLLGTAPASRAGDDQFSANFGGSATFADPPCPVKRFPPFESLVPVSKLIDPFAEDLIPFFCQIDVFKEGSGVKKAKGNFSSELIVVDNDSGTVQRIPVADGPFKTNKAGSASFDFDLPAELFADGFESGDVSAWSYTRTDFSNRKKADTATMSCDSVAFGGSQ